MDEINTLKDYIIAGCPQGEYVFKSKIHVREGGADTYRVSLEQPKKLSLKERYIKIEPINGKASEFEEVHVLIRQHLDDLLVKG